MKVHLTALLLIAFTGAAAFATAADARLMGIAQIGSADPGHTVNLCPCVLAHPDDYPPEVVELCRKIEAL